MRIYLFLVHFPLFKAQVIILCVCMRAPALACLGVYVLGFYIFILGVELLNINALIQGYTYKIVTNKLIFFLCLMSGFGLIVLHYIS